MINQGKSTILTHTGKHFDFLDMRSDMINIIDIAHALSNLCRFTGMTERFYSVAEHSVYCSRIVPSEFAFDALMHDAAEAYIGDVSAPLKSLLPDYREIEVKLEALLERIYNFRHMPNEVREADIVMLVTEQIQLMNKDDDWIYTGETKPANIIIEGWRPLQAEMEFLRRFNDLTGAKWAKTKSIQGTV